jgi:hypothetical protein
MVILQVLIRGVLGSNLCRDRAILTEAFHGLSQFLQTDFRIITSIKPRPLPSTSSVIYNSSVILTIEELLE